jgi:predicted nucleotidyltransferase
MTSATLPPGQSGQALSEMLAEWAAGNPKIRRVWAFGNGAEAALGAPGDIDIAVELQPVADSEETLVAWLANCNKWRSQLQARTGRAVNLDWVDPDGGMRTLHAGAKSAVLLVYELAS